MRSNGKRPKDAVEHDAPTESPQLDALLHENEDWQNRITTFTYRMDELLPNAPTPRKRKARASKAEPAPVGNEQTVARARRKR